MLAGARVLVVEDDFLIASDLSGEIEAAGGRVVGPYSTSRGALRALQANRVDGAILDANLGDGDVAPLAGALLERDLPVVIHTVGSLPAGLEAVRARLPIVIKPAAAAAVASLGDRLRPAGHLVSRMERKSSAVPAQDFDRAASGPGHSPSDEIARAKRMSAHALSQASVFSADRTQTERWQAIAEEWSARADALQSDASVETGDRDPEEVSYRPVRKRSQSLRRHGRVLVRKR